MNPYQAIFKCRSALLFRYRTAAIAGFCTQIFWGILKVMILSAFYAHASSSQPISLSQAIAFIWLGQSLLLLLPWNVDKDIEFQIKNGDVSYELIRPLNLYWLWFSRSLSLRVAPTFFRFVPLFLVALLFFDLSYPASWLAGLAFSISLVLAVLLSSTITTLVMISFFWTISGEGIQRLLPHLMIFLSGMTVPLPLFPEFLQPFLSAQPFRGLIDIPCRLYTGVIPVNEAMYYFGFQALWTGLFFIAGRWLINLALKRVVIQGG